MLSSMKSGDAADFAALVDGVFLRYRENREGRFKLVYISQSCEKLWGFTAEEILADDHLLWECVDPLSRPRLTEAIQNAEKSGQPWAEEWLIRDRKGAARWLKGRGQPSRSDSGATEWVVYVLDITDSSRASLITDTMRSNFRVLADLFEDLAVHRFGADLKINYWNPASERMYGYTQQEAIGRDVVDLLVPEEHRARWRRTFDEIRALRRRTTAFDGWLRRKDQVLVEVSGHVVLLIYPDLPSEFMCIDRDLTPRRKQEVDRASLEAQLRQSQKLEALGTLSSGVAHDFNNILAAILGNARLALMDAEGNHAVIESLNEIQRAGHRAKDLVQRILSFSRRTVTTRRMVAMDGVIAESVQLMRATAPKTLAIDVEVDPDTPPVLADASQLHQVFLNLFTNAIQAMNDPEHGSLKIRVATFTGTPVATERPGELCIVNDPHTWPRRGVQVRVEDNGCGMDDTTLSRLFEPFFTTKPVGVGTGLGMPVVHGILRDHQAAITVQTQPDIGSVFTVIFRAADNQTDTDADAPEPDGDITGASLSLNSEGRPSVILYVDDDELITAMVERMLKRAGFPVHMYASSKKALDDVRSGAAGYDLAVVDYMMPGMNGLELAKELRRLHPDKPVAITSGLISEELRTAAPQVGITELINKANTGGDLLKAIARLARQLAPDR